MATTRTTPEMTTFGEAAQTQLAALAATGGADSEGFLALGDTPSTYTGNGGLAVVVKAGEDGLEFATLVGGGTASFIGLTDVPGAYTNPFDVLEINAAGDGLQFRPPAPPAPDEFTDLTDTPSTLVGEDGKYLRVGLDGSGVIELVDPPPTGAQIFTQLQDTPDELGSPGTVLMVASNGLSLDFVDLVSTGGGGGATKFTDLEDTPAAILPGQFVRGASDGSGNLEFVAPTWPTTFVGMTDTPASYVGKALQTLRVNAGENGLEFSSAPVEILSLLQLSDTPGAYGTSGQLLALNGSNQLEWVDPAAGGVDEFTDLSDTPASFAGSNGQYVVSDGTELVFQDLPSIPSTLPDLIDFPASYSGNEGKFLAVNGLGSAVEFVDPPSSSGGGGSSSISPILVAVSDETNILTSGAGKLTFRAPAAFTLGSIRASLTTASSSGNVTVNVDMNGTTVFTTPLSIDATEKTSVTAGTPAVLSTTDIPDDAEFVIDVDSAGNNAVGLKLTFIPA